MTHTLTRTVKLNQPTQAYETRGKGKNKNAVEIPVTEALNDINKLITLKHNIVQGELDNLPHAQAQRRAINDYLTYHEEIDHEAGDRNFTKLPVQVALRAGIDLKDSLPDEIAVKSRVLWLILGELTSKLTAWDGSPRCKPSAGWDVNLGYVNVAMAHVTQSGKWVKLYLKAWDREIILVFRKPSCSLRKDEKLGLPIIRMDRYTGRLFFGCPVQSKVELPEISDRYVIGVDRGISKYFTAVVIDTVTAQPIVSLDSTGVVEEAHLKVARQDEQIRGLHQAIELAVQKRDYKRAHVLHVELDRVRRARTRTKTEMAMAGARLLTGLSRKFGNAVIIMENLSWSGNWASREPFGMLLHETEWLAEKEGLLCYTVNAAQTSQACSACQPGSYEPVVHSFVRRVYVCGECGSLLDRDVNASVNIAVRGAGRAVKSAATRSRTKECATPRRVRHGRARVRLVVLNNDSFKFWLADGGAFGRRSVSSGQGLVGPVAIPGVGWLAGYGVAVMKLRV